MQNHQDQDYVVLCHANLFQLHNCTNYQLFNLPIRIQFSERGDAGYGESIVSATNLMEHQGDAGYGESIDSATKRVDTYSADLS